MSLVQYYFGNNDPFERFFQFGEKSTDYWTKLLYHAFEDKTDEHSSGAGFSCRLKEGAWNPASEQYRNISIPWIPSTLTW